MTKSDMSAIYGDFTKMLIYIETERQKDDKTKDGE